MAEAKRDENRVTTLLGVSNADGVTPVVIWANPVTHALFVELAGVAGTVTSVSVVTANGISGSVATATTTPAITLTLGNITPTTVNGLTFTAQAVGFTIAGGTTSKTLTVPLDATVSGTNTGDQSFATLVPYTGATTDVDLGVHKISSQNADITQFMKFTGISDPATPAAGFDLLYSQLGVDGLARMTTLSPAGFALTIHRDMVQRVFNNTVGTINKGSAVYITGQSSGVPTIALAKADSIATDDVFGLTLADVAPSAYTTVQFAGQAKNIDTSAFNLGDKLYLSASSAGALTATAPTDPDFTVPIGVVLVKNASTGEIFLETDHPTHLALNNLTDVTITSAAVDDILKFNGAEWINGPGIATSAGPGISFYNSTPVINTRTAPGGISQDGTSGNGIKINSLSKTPVTTVTSTVTISHASPAVVTWTSHGLPIDAPVVFTTNGTLPAPLVAGTTYFIIATNYGTNSFEISATVSGAAINTTTDGSGVHTGTATELTASGQVVADTRAFAAWLYNTALGRTSISAGVWDFTTYCGVNNNTGTNTLTRAIYQVVPVSSGSVTTSGVGANSRTATITSSQFAGTYFNPSATNTVASYLQTPSGIFQITSISDVNTATITVPTGYSNENAVTFNIWNKLLESTTDDISAITPTFETKSFSVTAPAFTVAATDKLGAISFFTASTGTRTITLTFNGTVHNTRFVTPLTTLHNDLPGLQGGTSNEYYHLTSAEYTATATTGSGNFARLTSPQFTTPNIGSATGSVSGNAGTVTGFSLTAGKTLTVSDSATIATNAITLAGGEVITFSATNALTLTTTGTTVMTFPAATDTVATLAATQTFTNKRITPRIGGTTSSTTPTPDADSQDLYDLTALAAGATFGAITGTPVNGQKMIIRIKDNGGAQTLAWNSGAGGYVAGGVALPTTTVISKILTLGFMYNTANSLNKWCLIASAQEA